MAHLVDQMSGAGAADAPVRCPLCGHGNSAGRTCRHVRWTFDQGGPLDFAFFALETSPCTQRSGHRASQIAQAWWHEHSDWVIERIQFHFEAGDGYVFGEVARLDLLARDIWRAHDAAPAASRGQ